MFKIKTDVKRLPIDMVEETVNAAIDLVKAQFKKDLDPIKELVSEMSSDFNTVKLQAQIFFGSTMLLAVLLIIKCLGD